VTPAARKVLFRPRAAAAVAPAVLDGLANVTAAWSLSRKLLSAYAGALYTEVTGEVTIVHDQNGNSRHLTAPVAGGDEPNVGVVGPNNRACATNNGTNEAMRYNAAISNLITNSAGYIIMAVQIDAIATNAATIYQNDTIFSDGSQFIGFHLKNGGGSTYTGHAYNWDGNADTTTHASFPVGSVAVIEWRHDGGNVMSRVNGGTWQSAASGNTSTMTGNFFELEGTGGSDFTQGSFIEGAAFNAVPDATTRDALAANFMAWAA
jgi:hypothetical protein